MFKLPNKIPTLRDSAQDWADYAEFSAIKFNRISLLDLVKASQLISDEVLVDGITDDTDRSIAKIDDISKEINHRISIMNSNYPFQLIDNDYSIELKSVKSLYFEVYKFLLFATRINMTSDKVQGGIDGTQLFEKLSAEITASFFGENTEVDILGTSNAEDGGFRTKLHDISKRMREGGPLHQNRAYRPQDDGIDVIAWKGFSDKLSSQVIAFGQCKTGTSWRDRLSELNADAFCKKWFTRQPIVTPLRMFFCAQYFPKEIWYELSASAGLVFDRFRIIDYLPLKIDQELKDQITLWTSLAEAKYTQ